MPEIIFTGDLMCRPSMTEKTNQKYDIFFEKTDFSLRSADFTVGNLETPIAGEKPKYTYERYSFNTPESYVDALKKAGFNLLCLANNHIMDRGEQGILNTLENCRKLGVDTVGAFKTASERNKIYVKNIGGIKVAFLNYTYGTNAFAHHRYLEHKYMVNLFQPEECKEGSVFLLNSYEQIAKATDEIYNKGICYEFTKPYIEQLKDDIRRARNESDFVVMIMHSGGQYNDMPEAYTENLVKIIKSSGADLIVGHHPHIIQKSNYSNGILTAYSLGNFLFSTEDSKDRHIDPSGGMEIDINYSILLRLLLKKENGTVKAEYAFDLMKVIEKDGLPIPINTYELYEETGDAGLLSDIRFFVNRFAGKDVFRNIQRTYSLIGGH